MKLKITINRYYAKRESKKEGNQLYFYNYWYMRHFYWCKTREALFQITRLTNDLGLRETNDFLMRSSIIW